MSPQKSQKSQNACNHDFTSQTLRLQSMRCNRTLNLLYNAKWPDGPGERRQRGMRRLGSDVIKFEPQKHERCLSKLWKNVYGINCWGIKRYIKRR